MRFAHAPLQGNTHATISGISVPSLESGSRQAPASRPAAAMRIRSTLRQFKNAQVGAVCPCLPRESRTDCLTPGGISLALASARKVLRGYL